MTIHISPTTGCNLGCTYSAVAGTRVLTADLEWVPIEDLDLDDEVLCFDRPDQTTPDEHQKLRVSEITATYKYKEEAVRVSTDRGEVVVGETHPFLTKHHGFRDAQDFEPGQAIRHVVDPPTESEAIRDSDAYRRGYVHGAFAGDGTIVEHGRTTLASLRCLDREVTEAVRDYAPAEWQLNDGGLNTDGLHTTQSASPAAVDTIKADLAPPEEYEDSVNFKRGWLAGLFDTDGSFDGNTVRFPQNPSEIKERITQYLTDLGYEYVTEPDGVRVGGSGTNGVRFEILTEIQPQVSRKIQKYVGHAWNGTAEVEAVEPVGERVLYDVTVADQHTLVMEGLCSHNCYENPERELREEWVSNEYDMDEIFDRLEEWKEKYPNSTPGFHGGEPLLMRADDMEEIMEWIYDEYEEGGHIQTNATMMTERHIELFSKYDWSVGVSCDGPGELNKHRVAHEGGEDVTRKHTKRTIENIHRMREAGVSVGLIVVLHEANAGTDERLERLLDWIGEMNEIGVSGHYNPAIPYEDVQDDISLSPERLKEVYLRTWEWMKEERGRDWDPMRDFVDNLLALKLSNCVNNKCDVFNAGAAKIVKGNGETTGCGKTWSGVGDGGAFLQGPSTGNEYKETEERYDLLKETPGPFTDGEPDMGGCKGCDYWNVCQGGCPSAGMNYDYRNRTIWCEAVYALYEKIEKDIRVIFPNVRTITDLPWDMPIADLASKRKLDIAPFAAMDNSDKGKKSASGAFTHSKGSVFDRVSELLEQETPVDKLYEMYKKQYDEEIITYNPDSGSLHVDSSIRDNGSDGPKSSQSDPRKNKQQSETKRTDDSGWIKVDQDEQTNGHSSDGTDLQWGEFLDSDGSDDFAAMAKRAAALKEKYPDEYITIESDGENHSVHADSNRSDQ